jgi:hypothetical protein
VLGLRVGAERIAGRYAADAATAHEGKHIDYRVAHVIQAVHSLASLAGGNGAASSPERTAAQNCFTRSTERKRGVAHFIVATAAAQACQQ